MEKSNGIHPLCAPADKDSSDERKITFSFKTAVIAKCILCIMLGFTGVFSDMRPFSLGFYAAVFSKEDWPAYFISTIAGMILSSGLSSWIYVISAVMITVIFAVSDIRESVLKRCLCASVIYALFCGLHIFLSEASVYAVLALILEVLILMGFVFVSAYGYPVFLNPRNRSFISSSEKLFTFVFAATVILSFQNIPFHTGINFSSVMAILYIYILCFCASPETASVFGVVMGVIIAMNNHPESDVAGMFASGALLASVFGKYKKAGVVFGFVLASAGFSLLISEYERIYSVVSESLVAAVIFVFMPEKLITYFSSVFSSVNVRDENLIRQKIRRDDFSAFKKMAESYKELSHIYRKGFKEHSVSGGDYEIRSLVADQLFAISGAIGKICENESLEPNNGLEEKLRAILDKNSIRSVGVSAYTDSKGDFSIYISFRDGYITPEKKETIKACIDEALYTRSRFVSAEKNGSEITYLYCPASRYTVSFGYASKAKHGEKVSGDSFEVISSGKKSVMMALSDGMGSGETAHAESSTVTGLLSRFIRAGFDCDTAVRLINSSLLLKSSRDSFSTIDICNINLDEHTLSFTKLGAANAYIKTDSGVSVVYGKNLPAGILREIEIERHMLPINSDTVVVLVSDGVGDTAIKSRENEKWIEKKLRKLNTKNPQIIAAKILESAYKLENACPSDDMTVLVAYICDGEV